MQIESQNIQPEYISEKLSGPMEISAFLGWSISKFYNKKKELEGACAIYYEWQGRPPRKVVCSMRSLLLRWITLKSKKGEHV